MKQLSRTGQETIEFYKLTPEIINIKDSVGGLNGRLDTAGKKLVSWKIGWKKLSRGLYRMPNRKFKRS